MKKFYRIILLLIVLVFLSTYSPSGLNFFPEKNNIFFEIKKIKILGTDLVDKNIILEKLSGIYNKNILTIKRTDIETPLRNIDFLNKIEVKKKYPNTIIIKIYETKPIAILFKNKDKYFIDNSSNLISLNKNFNFDDLPMIFGDGAEHEFLHFYNQLKNNNFPIEKIKSYYYHKIGRWDLELLDNKIIKFPHKKISKNIKKSIELLNRKDFVNYNTIDLRIHGKIVVE